MKDLIAKCCVFFCFLAMPCWSQYQYDDQEAQNYSLADQTKNDMLVIVASGVGGAVLGLSTLSFVDEPSDHFDNVLTGAAVGLIIGVLYVAYRQAYGPSGIFAYETIELPSYQLYTKEFLEKRHLGNYGLASSSPPLTAFQWTWQF